jgi:D-3-phosphoglycerate dehydrogenase
MSNIDGVRHLRGHFKKALVLENPDDSLDEYLDQQGIETERYPRGVDEDKVVERLKEGQHDLLFKRSQFEVNRRVLQASDNLAAIMLCCIGDDSVDKQACAEEGVMVMNDPVSNGWSVVEMVLGEMVCLARRIFHSVVETGKSRWTKDKRQRYELKDKSLSIIGLGNIGKQVAQMAEQFGMEINFYDNHEVAREVGSTLGWNACGSITEAFRQGDFVTVHVSAEDHRGNDNKGLLNYEEHFSQLGAERPSNSPRIFINASRGFLYGADELIPAVEEEHIRQALVDVFPSEPSGKEEPWENPYAEHDRIWGTPHIGAATQEAQPRIAKHMGNTTFLFNRYGSVRDQVFAAGGGISVDSDDPEYVLTVVHSDARGTKKAVNDCIYEAGLSNLGSSHRDFPRFGVAYDVNAIDKPLTQDQLAQLVETARDLSGDENAIRSVRMIDVSTGPTEGAAE